MKTLKGKITCNLAGKAIEEGAVAKVSLVDCSLMDAPAVTLGQVVINNPKAFPFDYEIQYDERRINMAVAYGFAVGCRIEKAGKLLFINDTRHPLIDESEAVLARVDVDVIVVQ